MGRLKEPRYGGICLSIHRSRLSKEAKVQLETRMINFLKFKKWYSGNSTYPIAHGSLLPEDAYNKCLLWTPFTEYGSRRRATLRHLNKYLSKGSL